MCMLNSQKLAVACGMDIRLRTFAIPLLFISLQPILSASALDDRSDSHSFAEKPNMERLAVYAALVEETELRRRVNVLFPNPQSIFDGFQAGHVGVRHGNLTFRRRDIVASDGWVTFSRVYDSRIRYTRDFGPGWRLAWAEELTILNGDLIYADGSGSRHEFRLASQGMEGNRTDTLAFQPEFQIGANSSRKSGDAPFSSEIYMAYPATPQHAATTITIAGHLAVLRTGKATRVFEQQVASNGASTRVFRLRSVTARGKTLMLSYQNGLIDTISDSNGEVFSIERDRFGRIVSVQDRSGRAVNYSYDDAGRLTDVWDIAGNVWSYEYAPHNALIRVIGPNSKDVLRVVYDQTGRVMESNSGREYSLSIMSTRPWSLKARAMCMYLDITQPELRFISNLQTACGGIYGSTTATVCRKYARRMANMSTLMVLREKYAKLLMNLSQQRARGDLITMHGGE